MPIDAPELTQPFGREAKRRLESLAVGADVRVEITGTDYRKRSVGRVWVGELCINTTLVREGLAWWYRRYALGDEELCFAHVDAQDNQRGLWTAEAIAPWEWRKAPRGKR